MSEKTYRMILSSKERRCEATVTTSDIEQVKRQMLASGWEEVFFVDNETAQRSDERLGLLPMRHTPAIGDAIGPTATDADTLPSSR